MNKSDIWQLNHGQNHESKQFNARVPPTSTPIIGIYVPNQTLEHIYIQYQKYQDITRMHLQLINLYESIFCSPTLQVIFVPRVPFNSSVPRPRFFLIKKHVSPRRCKALVKCCGDVQPGDLGDPMTDPFTVCHGSQIYIYSPNGCRLALI